MLAVFLAAKTCTCTGSKEILILTCSQINICTLFSYNMAKLSTLSISADHPEYFKEKPKEIELHTSTFQSINSIDLFTWFYYVSLNNKRSMNRDLFDNRFMQLFVVRLFLSFCSVRRNAEREFKLARFTAPEVVVQNPAVIQLQDLKLVVLAPATNSAVANGLLDLGVR